MIASQGCRISYGANLLCTYPVWIKIVYTAVLDKKYWIRTLKLSNAVFYSYDAEVEILSAFFTAGDVTGAAGIHGSAIFGWWQVLLSRIQWKMTCYGKSTRAQLRFLAASIERHNCSDTGINYHSQQLLVNLSSINWCNSFLKLFKLAIISLSYGTKSENSTIYWMTKYFLCVCVNVLSFTIIGRHTVSCKR